MCLVTESLSCLQISSLKELNNSKVSINYCLLLRMPCQRHPDDHVVRNGRCVGLMLSLQHALKLSLLS